MTELSQSPIRTSQAFNLFSYGNFVVAAVMMAGGSISLRPVSRPRDSMPWRR